jgi:hypothetical protein
MLNKMQPRDHLRAAIAEREKRRQSVETAEAALGRGNGLLRDAEASLAQLSDVDDAIAAHHAQKVKTWAGTGGERPNADVPANLVERRKARDETREEVEAAKIACKALSDELDEAKLALAEAERTASEATVPVMSEEAKQISSYLTASRRQVWHLEAQLRALGETWLPTGKDGAPTPVRLSRQVLDALSAQEPQYPPSMRPEIKQSAAWRSFHAALLHDPEMTWDRMQHES